MCFCLASGQAREHDFLLEKKAALITPRVFFVAVKMAMKYFIEKNAQVADKNDDKQWIVHPFTPLLAVKVAIKPFTQKNAQAADNNDDKQSIVPPYLIDITEHILVSNVTLSFKRARS